VDTKELTDEQIDTLYKYRWWIPVFMPIKMVYIVIKRLEKLWTQKN
jgi:hypothetical protein